MKGYAMHLNRCRINFSVVRLSSLQGLACNTIFVGIWNQKTMQKTILNIGLGFLR
jgi:hypothetical protein